MTDQTPAADIVEEVREAIANCSGNEPSLSVLCRAADQAADEIERLRTILADMPTIWEDPAGKGYPCQERPMTSAEVRDEITRLRARDIGWRLECEELRARLEVAPGWSEDADGIACRDDTIALQDARIATLQRKLDEAVKALEHIQSCTSIHGGAAVALRIIKTTLTSIRGDNPCDGSC